MQRARLRRTLGRGSCFVATPRTEVRIVRLSHLLVRLLIYRTMSFFFFLFCFVCGTNAVAFNVYPFVAAVALDHQNVLVVHIRVVAFLADRAVVALETSQFSTRRALRRVLHRTAISDTTEHIHSAKRTHPVAQCAAGLAESVVVCPHRRVRRRTAVDPSVHQKKKNIISSAYSCIVDRRE
jgi:hypothetical protein